MAKKTDQQLDYQALQTELDAIIADLQREDIAVDQALQHYERGLEIVKLLDDYLQTAENKVRKLQARFDGEAT